MPLFASSIYWDLPILLVVVSLVYSATRHDRWDRIAREALGWIVRMTGFLGGLGVLLYVLSTRPKLWPYAAVIIGIGTIIYYALTSPLFRKKATAPASSSSNPPATATKQ